MNNISATDLILIPELSHLKHIEVVDPKNDELIKPFLKVLGADTDYPVVFKSCQHRNMQNKVVVSYLISWEIEINAAFQESAFCSQEDKLVAAGYRDLGLAHDMAKSMTNSRDYGDENGEGFPPDQCNPDEADILMQIKVLDDLLLMARGNPYKNDGSRKLYGETHVEEAPEKRRKKSERKQLEEKLAETQE